MKYDLFNPSSRYQDQRMKLNGYVAVYPLVVKRKSLDLAKQ